MQEVQIFILNERLNLFKDETITLNSSVKNYKEVGKIFTDFTQSFTVPASKNNNKIFKHAYNADILNGYIVTDKVSAEIKLNGYTYKLGKVQLNSIEIENGVASNYKITFYGNTVNLGLKFGDDKLSNLSFEDYNHIHSFENVQKGASSNNLKSGNVIYPLISTAKNWQWGGLGVNDIKSDVSNTNAIEYTELKPAIKVIDIINQIESKYSINFSTDFFGDTHFQNLWMWCQNSKEKLNTVSNGEQVSLDIKSASGIGWDIVNNDYTIQTGDDIITSSINMTARYVSVNYTVYMYVNGILNSSISSVGIDTLNFFVGSESTGDKITFSISYGSEFQYDMQLSRTLPASPSNNAIVNTSDNNVFMANSLPDIKIIDFLSGLFKVFNLIVLPTSENDFFTETLTKWYNAGNTYEFDQVDFEQNTIKPPELYNKINFLYNETDTAIGAKFRDLNNGIGYGDLIYDGDNGDNTFNIKLPFENITLEKLIDIPSGFDSNLHVGKSIDAKGDAVLPKPFLFYNRGFQNSTPAYGMFDEVGTIHYKNAYHNIGQEDSILTATTSTSLNFGSEISTYNYEKQTSSLFSNYWSDFIVDLYDSRRRIYNYTAYLSLSMLLKLKLNDTLIINNRKLLINNLSINLTTRKAEFELINDIYEVSGLTGEAFGTSEGVAAISFTASGSLTGEAFGTSDAEATISSSSVTPFITSTTGVKIAFSCSRSLSPVRYHNGIGSNPTVNDTVYSDASGLVTFNGGIAPDNWYLTDGLYSIQINASGLVTTINNCI